MIGVDVVDIERLRTTFERAPEIERRLFTSSESAYCRATNDPMRHFAGTLAAKEAVIKAGRFGPLPAWSRRIEIARDGDGVPTVRVHDVVHPPIQLSISHDGGVAVAIALAL